MPLILDDKARVCLLCGMVTAAQIDMFPTLPRNTVDSDIRADWNRFKRDQEELGGLLPMSLARVFLGISKQRLHELCDQGKIRFVTHDGYRYISGDDIKQRLADLRDGKLKGGRPAKRLDV